ncbi:SHOCT domain-containing protein [Halobaculum litoreum]|uniref:SHOCT domain-containing protein n=1 Tax=Halobaculum litoreum TaxID=3031998 RepID=A0ABD5XSS6_9EURY|nr:SHOCT domain-containing protein [Halobaculum sp. DT92]
MARAVGGLITTLLVLALLGAVVYGAVVLARGDGAVDGPERRRDDDALAVLDRRYARGELDDEEYERRRQRLTGN